ncbi:MAG: response regulator transcription factor [Candidatus Dormibacteraeota bacterium]|nr:response regulator transcription factor [Candidatus Dormibacteraeota bacterium]MBO0743955.1 response regulator transcription factor [Candidatus Dormibacteraeota bacterium]
MPDSDDAPAQVRILIVDDHEVVRDGLRAMLSAQSGFHVVGEAASVHQATAAAESLRPDVIIMDVRLTDGSGIDATRDIRAQRPETRVLMLTSYADDEALFASIMAGASGYVLKQIRMGELINAVRAVAAGQSLLDPAVTSAVLERLRRGKHLLRDEKLSRLTPQEERILELVAEGQTNRDIGLALHLAEKTVKNYVSTILSKLEVARRAEAAAYLARHTSTPGSSTEG